MFLPKSERRILSDRESVPGCGDELIATYLPIDRENNKDSAGISRGQTVKNIQDCVLGQTNWYMRHLMWDGRLGTPHNYTNGAVEIKMRLDSQRSGSDSESPCVLTETVLKKSADVWLHNLVHR